MLTGNTPPALIRTHPYYQQHLWRRLSDDEELRRHADMHDRSGPTTAGRWEEKHWPETLPAGSDGSPQASQIWTAVDLPPDIAEQLATTRVELTEPSVRRRAFRTCRNRPGNVVAAIVTLPQLRVERPHLDLSDMPQEAWELSHHALADDVSFRRWA